MCSYLIALDSSSAGYWILFWLRDTSFGCILF